MQEKKFLHRSLMLYPDDKISLDLDKDRIKTVLSAAYGICKDYFKTDFLCTAEEFVSKINIYLDSNRVSIPVILDLPVTKFNHIQIEVNLRRQKVFARVQSKTKQAELNYMLKAL